MGDRRDKMQLKSSSKDTFDMLVHSICVKTQLTENTVRELFQDGWRYLEENRLFKWVKEN